MFGVMKALVLNAVGGGFDLNDVDIAAPMGREVLVEVRASGLCQPTSCSPRMTSRNPDVAKISVTGSVVVGQQIMRDGAATMKRATLELGGKSPTVLLDDAA